MGSEMCIRDRAYVVEPPIHYAAKWAIEAMLTDAKLPVTFLRKCPYHENFTKLTKAEAKQSRLAPGEHKIKALTPARFEYATARPRDRARARATSRMKLRPISLPRARAGTTRSTRATSGRGRRSRSRTRRRSSARR